jgi:hypothetical protein
MRAQRTGALALAMLGLAAGCGGGNETTTPAGTPSAKSVEEAVFRGGIQQNVRCQPAGTFGVRGAQRRVFRCSFEEEKDVSGVMRDVNACYVLQDGALIDVTRELPAGTSCAAGP